MIKYFCDSCGEEKQDINREQVPCHLYSLSYPAYTDMEHNPVSGRRDEIHLCNACRNIMWTAALESVNLLHGGTKKND